MTDPTVQAPIGPPRDATGSIVVSLSEVDAMVRKAARGAGYAWGMAEEAGRAARWLGFAGVNPSPLFGCLFDYVDGKVPASIPAVSRSPWSSEKGILCPISTGVALADRRASFTAGSAVQLGKTLCPVLLMPFLAWIARSCSLGVQVRADAISIAWGEGGCSGTDLGSLQRVGQTAVEIAFEDGGNLEAITPPTAGVSTEISDWRRLDEFAKRTYVPATEVSRLSGAGAGTTDND